MKLLSCVPIVIVQSLSGVWLSCDPMDCSPPGSSVREIPQARTLEWVTISFSRGSSWLRDWIQVSCFSRRILYHWTTKEAPCFPADSDDTRSAWWSFPFLGCRFLAETVSYWMDGARASIKLFNPSGPWGCVCVCETERERERVRDRDIDRDRDSVSSS